MVKKTIKRNVKGTAKKQLKPRSIQGKSDVKELFRELANNPTVRYVSGGVAAALLSKLANKLARHYPELSSFIKENTNNFEEKLNEIKSENSAVRH